MALELQLQLNSLFELARTPTDFSASHRLHDRDREYPRGSCDYDAQAAPRAGVRFARHRS